jgi:hypothetical protein
MKITRRNVIRGIGVLLVTGVLTYVSLRVIDPTFSADFVFDSPDGKYRCTVIPGGAHYECGLFSGRWPHAGLRGDCGQVYCDSIPLSDFRATWLPNGVAIDFTNILGIPERRVGHIIDGRQKWEVSDTSKADRIFDSPDGKHRCAVFGLYGDSHKYEYEVGLFSGEFPNRELSGERVLISGDSGTSMHDFKVTWLADGVQVDFKTGEGEGKWNSRMGRIKDGTQRWE